VGGGGVRGFFGGGVELDDYSDVCLFGYGE